MKKKSKPRSCPLPPEVFGLLGAQRVQSIDAVWVNGVKVDIDNLSEIAKIKKIKSLLIHETVTFKFTPASGPAARE
jgi:hypothetical protein